MTFFISVGCCLVLSVALALFGVFKRSVLEPLFMAVGLVGIVLLCQPFSFDLYTAGFATLLTGMVGFNVAIHMKNRQG
jgi:hypothetical protein